jgi:hypothetical protein
MSMGWYKAIKWLIFSTNLPKIIFNYYYWSEQVTKKMLGSYKIKTELRNMKEKGHLENLDVDGLIILKCIEKK